MLNLFIHDYWINVPLCSKMGISDSTLRFSMACERFSNENLFLLSVTFSLFILEMVLNRINMFPKENGYDWL